MKKSFWNFIKIFPFVRVNQAEKFDHDFLLCLFLAILWSVPLIAF